MDIVTECAKYLNQGLCDWAMQWNASQDSSFEAAGAACVDVANAKALIFNICTASLIASVALGVFGSITPASAVLLGGCSFFGRRVVEKSFNPLASGSIRNFFLNLPKLNPCLRVGKIVIFYEITPRS